MKKRIKNILTALCVMILCAITLTGCIANDASVLEIAKQNMLNNSQNIADWGNSNNGNHSNTPVTIEQEISNITVNNEYSQFSTYDNYLALKENEGYEGSFSDFLNEYVYNSSTISNSVEACVNSRLMSVVSIVAEFHSSSSSYPYRETTKTTDFSAGSGVIYKLDKENGDAYIITNYHVIYSSSYYTSDLTKVTCNNVANRIICYLYGTDLEVKSTGTQNSDGYDTYTYGPYAIECEFLGGSANYDIAVLKVSNSETIKNSDATQATIKNCSDIIVGESAIVIGNPEANGFSATAGIVSVDSEYITMTNVYNVTQKIRVIRIDAAVNGGNSGGGLFDVNGNLIGIVNAKLVDEEVENIGYAIPSDIAIGIANNIIKNCNGSDQLKVKKATLGITLKTIYTKSVYDTGTLKANIIETVAIDSVTTNSLADGILEENQIIKQITISSKDLDGNDYNKVIPITRLYQVVDSTLSLCVGDTITFTIESADGTSTNEITFTITQDAITTID